MNYLAGVKIEYFLNQNKIYLITDREVNFGHLEQEKFLVFWGDGEIFESINTQVYNNRLLILELRGEVKAFA